jgi:hypothetical protein
MGDSHFDNADGATNASFSVFADFAGSGREFISS